MRKRKSAAAASVRRPAKAALLRRLRAQRTLRIDRWNRSELHDGNSFVCVSRVWVSRARLGRQHRRRERKFRFTAFRHQAVRYVTGNLRVVDFYPSHLTGDIERFYHPGA